MKLSIITINLNNAAGLQKTIESVVSQTFADYEYIVIDGGSTDGSVDVIKRYADKITYWVSEPDRGIYHAMNKGITLAKGEYCQFLNSGDWIVQPDGLQYVFDKNPIEDIVYCDVQYYGKPYFFADQLTLRFFFEESISHQASFIKRALFSIYGLYNEKYKIISDWEFFLKAIFKEQCSYRHIQFVLIDYDLNGISSSYLYEKLNEKEREEGIKEHFPMMFDFYQRLVFLRNSLAKINNTLLEMGKEINVYKQSRLIQFVRKIQSTGFYRKMNRFKKNNKVGS